VKRTNPLVAAAYFAATLLLAACPSPSSDSGGDDADYPDFIDQNLQGEFNGKEFSFVSGYAEESIFEDGAYDLQLYNTAPEAGLDPWSLLAYPDGHDLEVMVTVPGEVNTTEFYWDMDTGESQTATLVDWNESPVLNIIVTSGAVEITEIDLADGTLTGRMVATDGEGNEVNGNFTLPIAPAD
jgi:hypothetical protein